MLVKWTAMGQQPRFFFIMFSTIDMRSQAFDRNFSQRRIKLTIFSLLWGALCITLMQALLQSSTLYMSCFVWTATWRDFATTIDRTQVTIGKCRWCFGVEINLTWNLCSSYVQLIHAFLCHISADFERISSSGSHLHMACLGANLKEEYRDFPKGSNLG